MNIFSEVRVDMKIDETMNQIEETLLLRHSYPSTRLGTHIRQRINDVILYLNKTFDAFILCTYDMHQFSFAMSINEIIEFLTLDARFCGYNWPDKIAISPTTRYGKSFKKYGTDHV